MTTAGPAIRAYRPDDEDAVIDLWLTATISGQDFLPEFRPDHEAIDDESGLVLCTMRLT